MRHRSLEDFFLKHLDSVSQVVMLGAGFDTKFQRHVAGTPRERNLTFIEVDGAAVLSQKRKALLAAKMDVTFAQESAELITSATQFREFCKRLDPLKPTLFLGEGFFMYLDRKEAVGIWKAAHEVFRGPLFFGFDLLDPSYQEAEENQRVINDLAKHGERSLSWYDPKDVTALFVAEGAKTKLLTPSALQDHYYGSTWKGRDDKYVFLAERQ